ncbi:MAG: TonB-dependent receptor, partial [Rhodothermales bacterium]
TVRFDLSGFASRYTDQIVWTAGADYWYPENISRTTSRGFEVALDVHLSELFSTGVVYALTRAVDRSDPAVPSFGRQLRYVPLHQAKAHASLEVGPARIDANTRYVGRRYVTGVESEHLPATVVADAQISVQRNAGAIRARLSIVVENLFDARYAVMQGYPMPPRHARLRLLFETR